MTDFDDPTLPRVSITIDPETCQYVIDFDAIDYEVWVGVLNDMIKRTQEKDLPGIDV